VAEKYDVVRSDFNEIAALAARQSGIITIVIFHGFYAGAFECGRLPGYRAEKGAVLSAVTKGGKRYGLSICRSNDCTCEGHNAAENIE
jgi:hypothetical protein